jgi:tetratricopeptide (TPR) repeat protein
MIKKLGFLIFFCILILPPAQCANESSTPIDTGFDQIISQANIFLQQKDYPEAIEKYSEALKIDAKSAVAYFNRGRAFLYSDNFSAAVDDFSAAIEFNLKYTDAYKYRGWANVANGAIERGVSDFTEVVNLSPEQADGYFGRAWCYLNTAQWERSSLLYLYQRFESDTGLSDAYQDKSWHYVKELQWDLSVVPDPSSAASQIPDITEVICNRGFAYFKKAQWDAAIRDLEKEIAFDPALNRGNWNVEWTTGKKQQWDLAIADYNKIVKLMGSNVQDVSIFKDNLETYYALAVDDYEYVENSSTDSSLILKAQTALAYMSSWRQDIGWQFIQ